jgi:hypothetical protein
MDLKDFITATLVQIQEGVQAAIEQRSGSGNSAGVINPAFGSANNIGTMHQQVVEFDVAVTVSDKAGAAAKGGLKIFSVVDIGGEGSKSNEQSTVSRIKFGVPIIPPMQVVTRTDTGPSYTRDDSDDGGY